MKRVATVMALVVLLGLGGWSRDEPSTPSRKPPAQLKEVGIDPHPGGQLPLDATFRDETGQTVRLGDYFGKRPVILTLVYLKCPMLCTLVLNDVTRSLNVLREDAGKDFDIITVSFDPRETPELANAKKQQYLRMYQRPTAAAGWHFLTGDEAQIHKLTQAVGFRYTFDPKTQQFVHPSGVVVVSPDGKLMRYFYGIEYSATDIRLALIDAARGKVASPTGTVLYYCFQYDPTTGRYSLAIFRMVQVGFVLTVTAIVAFMVVSHFRHGRGASVEGQQAEAKETIGSCPGDSRG